SLPSVIPIGRPIANTQLYVLDRQMQPVPLGAHGELYIGGDGVGRGYLNQPALTGATFVPDPFSGTGGGRLYKTGDLARYLADGTLEFLGRIDQQVKLRGFRIELGEIEAVLAEHPAVREAVVLLREDTPGDPRLVAYVATNQAPSNQESETWNSELRQFLGARLPAYMIPSAFVLLDALPLTENGKVDRRVLPAPERSGLQAADRVQPPRTPTEEAIAGIWSEVLQLDRIGMRDNFFELGGHSLLATQVIARLRSTFQIDLPVHRLFETPTIAALAEHIDMVRWATSGIDVPADDDREEGRL
ncbi:MAG TPA: phosphopantetheine-binding protein, partial [Herpetosiphonaceae bacterium]